LNGEEGLPVPAWSCPKCGEHVDANFDVCWNCGTAADGSEDPGFLTADQTGPIFDPVEDDASLGAEALEDDFAELLPDVVPCHSFRDVIEAQFVANQLRERGIPAIADRHDVDRALGALLANSRPSVRVRPQDLERAQAWIQSYERARKRRDEIPN
jgi:hypothetical protein